MAARKEPARTKRASASGGTSARASKNDKTDRPTANTGDETSANADAGTSGKSEPPKTAGGGRTAPQINSLVTKVFELADASVGLGINMISLLAGFARTQAAAAASAATCAAAGAASPSGTTGAAPPPASPGSSANPTQDATSPSPASPPPEPARSYCIVNRLPIRPGDTAKVSFSINNDQPDAAKKLALSCGTFTGGTQNFPIPDGQFAIEPASASIGPMDFERFVLHGAIPAAAPVDTYNGWIQVEGDESMRIPVVLMIT